MSASLVFICVCIYSGRECIPLISSVFVSGHDGSVSVVDSVPPCPCTCTCICPWFECIPFCLCVCICSWWECIPPCLSWLMHQPNNLCKNTALHGPHYRGPLQADQQVTWLFRLWAPPHAIPRQIRDTKIQRYTQTGGREFNKTTISPLCSRHSR